MCRKDRAFGAMGMACVLRTLQLPVARTHILEGEGREEAGDAGGSPLKRLLKPHPGAETMWGA